MFDKHLEISHKIHNLLAETFNNLASKYHVSQDDCTKLHDTLAEVDSLVKSKGILVVSEQPTKPTSREIIKAMLERGDKYVPCYVSRTYDPPNEGSYLDFIVCVHNDGRFYNQLMSAWKYATPFDPRTGQPITELPQ